MDLWPYRKRIDLPLPTADLTDFPVEVPIIADAAIGAAARADGFDIRFTAADGTTLLPYERESWSGGGGSAVTAVFWVKTDVAMAGTYLWLYYGNSAAPDGQNAEAVWDANFKAVYHMKDATTSTILDSTGNDNDGAKLAANEPIEATGKIGKGQDFDGAGDKITLAYASLHPVQLMVSAWFKPNATAGGVDSTYTETPGVLMCGLSLLKPWIQLKIDGGAAQELFGGTVVARGAWNYESYGYDGTDITVWLNGILDGTLNAPGIIQYDGAAFLIGANAWGGFQKGLIDEVRVSSIARSAAWIAYEYANMNPADGGLTWGAEVLNNNTISDRLWILAAVDTIKSSGTQIIVRKIVFKPSLIDNDVVIQEYGPGDSLRNAIVIRANHTDVNLVSLDWGPKGKKLNGFKLATNDGGALYVYLGKD